MTPEEERTRSPESATPPGGLKVLPNGEIVYEFEGVIVATGLKLFEGNASEPDFTKSVQWIEAATGLARELLYGYKAGEGHVLLISTKAGGADETGMTLEAHPTLSFAQINIFARTAFKTLLDANEKSDFTQNVGLLKRTIQGGTVLVKFPVESFVSETVTVNHGLGTAVFSLQLTSGASEASLVPVTPRYIEGAKTANTFKFKLLCNVKVTAGTEILVDWLAYG